MDFAKKEQKPIIFTTDDRKEDWWNKHKGKTIGPRPELIQEMISKTGMMIYLYQTDQFMSYAAKYLKLETSATEAISEVSKIRADDENKQRFYYWLSSSYKDLLSEFQSEGESQRNDLKLKLLLDNLSNSPSPVGKNWENYKVKDFIKQTYIQNSYSGSLSYINLYEFLQNKRSYAELVSAFNKFLSLQSGLEKRISNERKKNDEQWPDGESQDPNDDQWPDDESQVSRKSFANAKVRNFFDDNTYFSSYGLAR